MSPEDPMKLCSCRHPVSGHEAKSSVCFVDGCMCGWEIRGGVKYRSHPLFDERIMPFARTAFNSQAHVIPEPSFPIRQRIPSDPPARVKGIKEHERKFPGQPCYYCGDAAESVDHLIPRSKGGSSAISNLVPACNRCNQMKGNLSYDEFIDHLKKVLQTVRQMPGKVIQQEGGSLWRVVA